MRNRWFHTPTIHTPAPGHEKRVSWLELFYDLVFVATFIQLGNTLSEEISLLRFLSFAGLFVPIWLAWTSFTFYVNRFVVDDFTHRFLVFIQMFAIAAMAVSIPDVLQGQPTHFAFAFALARFMIAILYLRAFIQVSQAKALSKRWMLLFFAEAFLWFASVMMPEPLNYFLWAIAIGISLSIPLNKHSRELALRYPPDVLHMSERYGLLIIIVLGESFVKALTSIYEQGVTVAHGIIGGIGLCIICSLWWIYFDDVAGSRIRKQRGAAFIWIYTHLPLTLAITAIGVAIKKSLLFDLMLPAPEKYRWLLAITLALAFFAVAIIDSVTERRQAELSDRARVNMRFVSALILLLLAPTGEFMPSWFFLACVAVLCFGQVVFDLIMAPLEADQHTALYDAQSAIPTFASQDLEADKPKRVKRRADVTESVRKGAPPELRRDFYFFFMEGSWLRLILSLAVLYLMVNFIFAMLYLLEPGAVANVRPGSLSDAFFFSVQTISTVGFGGMLPQTTYGHMIVTIEVATGVLGVALATGLMFAKAARPSSGALFSNVILVNRHHGKQTLMLRVGNARGNEIIDASVKAVVLKEDLSPEGQKIRKMYDLVLRRSHSPLFSLSWTIFHEIDEASPLYGVDWKKPEQFLTGLVVTLTGYDATYSQTIYARHFYYPENFRDGYDFVDVISELEDGRFLVDYTKFHEIKKQ